MSLFNKRSIFALIILVFLLLDFTALDDITTGNEPNFFLEYLTLGVSAVVFGSVVYILLRKKRKS